MSQSNRIKSLEIVPLARLSVPGFIAVFSYPRKSEKLLASLRENGLVNPVLVAAAGDGGMFTVVCGAKRVDAARELGWEKIPALIIENSPPTDRELFAVALAENASSRTFNVAECAGIVSVLTDVYAGRPKNEMDTQISHLGLQGSPHMREIYAGIHRLEDDIKTYLVHWNVSAAHAALLSSFSQGDRRELFSVVQLLRLHGGKLRQFLELVFEISRRDKTAVHQIFSRKAVAAVLENSKITRNQKQAKVMDWLINQRFPRLTERLRRFSDISAEMHNIEKGVFSPPHNFEGDTIRASLAFNRLEDLDRFCSAVQNKSNRDKIQDLLNLL